MTTSRQALQARRALDQRLSALRTHTDLAVPHSGWLRAVRDALGMSAAVLGRRVGVSAQAVLALEASEVSGRVRLDSLRRAADAMDCDLVYALLPRAGLEATVQDQARRVAEAHLKATAHTMALEGQYVELDDQAVKRQVAEIVAAGRQWRDEP